MSTEAKFTAVMTGDIEAVRQLGAPIEVVGDVVRATICAPPGHRLLVGDFTGIESIVLAWIAEQPDKIAQWEKFLRTQDRSDHPYISIARALGFSGDEFYNAGKRADLAFGYQGGAGAYKNFAPADDTASEAQIEGFKHAWRGRHPQVVQFWYGIDRAAIAAVNRPKVPVRYARLSLICEQIGNAPFLFITLPSGRRLAYPFPKLITNRFDRPAVEFMDNSLTNGGWVPCNHGTGAYGGLWTENIVSGIARDLLAAAMQRLEAAGYPVVLHVHDEIVCELPDGEGSLEEFKDLIQRRPAWAAGLPVAAKVRNGPRFAAIDAPVVHVAGATETVPLKPRQKQTARPVVDIGPIVAGPPITDVSFSSADPRGRLVAWVIEREAIRQRKEADAPWPWTDEPILSVGRFCNVYREHDAVTRWITANIVERFRDDADLWFALTLARCINEPGALAELLPHLLPFNAAQCLAALQARQARGDKVFRTDAYKPPTPPQKSMSTAVFLINDVLMPIWRERDALRPQPGDTLDATSARLEACYRIGPFLAAQIVADLKHVAPLKDAPDWWTFARPGPGSERGLNRVRGRDVGKSWSPMAWYRELLALQIETKDLFAAAGLPPLDAQNLQNICCEFDKWERAREKGGKPARRYQPAAEAESKPRSKKPKPANPSPQQPVEPQGTDVLLSEEFDPDNLSAELLAAIDADEAQRAAAAAPPANVVAISLPPAPSKASPPPGGNGSNNEQRRHSSFGESPHGNSGAPRGQVLATYIYDHPDLPPPHFYLLVEKRLDTAGNRHFFQYRWEGGRWQPGVKGTYAERKVPYQLRALKVALAADPNIEVQITEGEKDAETLRRLGLVATTNPGGADQWTDDLTAWLRTLGVRRIVLHEDNDAAGRKRTQQLAPALSSFATVRVARYPDVPAAEDVTYWVEALGHSIEDLAARIAAAEPADAVNFTDTPLTSREWLARDLPAPDLLLGHLLSTTARAILNATTGIGKTNFAMAVSGHIGAGKDFLHWHCPRPRQILYVDGEMPLQLVRERIADVVRRLGELPAGAHFFSRYDMPGFAPLNTRDGQVAVWALINEVERRSGQKLDAICFDSIMALLVGDMKEEDAWRETLPLVHALTARHIGQLWVHHTGHDTSHGYGTKTREWQLDTVLHLDEIENKPPDIDVAFRLSFKKARTRTPANRLDFVDTTITLNNDQWAGVLLSNARGKINESLTLKFYEALSAAADSSSVARTGSYPTASLGEWRAQCLAWGLLDSGKADSVRSLFSRHKLRLIAANWIACSEELAWVLP